MLKNLKWHIIKIEKIILKMDFLEDKKFHKI
jgi:hypothetical protein